VHPTLHAAEDWRGMIDSRQSWAIWLLISVLLCSLTP